MKRNLIQTPVVDTTEAAEFLDATKQAFNRDALVVESRPLFALAADPWVLPDTKHPKLVFRPMRNRSCLTPTLATFVQIDNGRGSHFIRDKLVVVEGVVASIGENMSRRDVGVSQWADEIAVVASLCCSDFDMYGNLVDGVTDDVCLVSEPPVVTSTLTLLAPSGVGVTGRVLVAIGVSPDVGGIYGDNFAKIGEVFTKPNSGPPSP